MTLEIIIKGTILGIVFLVIGRYLHWLGFKQGFTEGAGYILEQLKEMSKKHKNNE